MFGGGTGWRREGGAQEDRVAAAERLKKRKKVYMYVLVSVIDMAAAQNRQQG